jgi:predicted anti-sigma-YlaC factor YlaD
VLSLLLKPWIASHRETRKRLSDYLEGELNARTRARITRHLARCDGCRALLESLTRTLDQLRSLGSVEQVAPEPATADGVIARIRREQRPP